MRESRHSLIWGFESAAVCWALFVSSSLSALSLSGYEGGMWHVNLSFLWLYTEEEEIRILLLINSYCEWIEMKSLVMTTEINVW